MGTLKKDAEVLGNEEEERGERGFLRRREEEALSMKTIFVKRVGVESSKRVCFDTSVECFWWKEEAEESLGEDKER